MENLVLMLKDRESGYLVRELAIIPVNESASLISGAYVAEENDSLFVHLTLTCGVDVSDEDFDRIYDEYGDEFESDTVTEIIEVDGYNPTWEMIFPYYEDREAMEAAIGEILESHLAELERVMNRGCR